MSKKNTIIFISDMLNSKKYIIKESLKSYMDYLSKKHGSAQTYASLAMKSKLSKVQQGCFSNYDQKHIINNHLQYVTDFDLIYEQRNDIRIYAIGSLCTNPQPNSFELSALQNYRLENKPQNMIFFEKPLPVQAEKAYINTVSRTYFEKSEIKSNIHSNDHYKKLRDQVITELKQNNINFREAENEKELSQTALNLILKENNVNPVVQPTAEKLTPIELNVHEKSEIS